MKDFCKDLREHVMKIINHEKKKMMPLLYQKKNKYHEQKFCRICKKEC